MAICNILHAKLRLVMVGDTGKGICDAMMTLLCCPLRRFQLCLLLWILIAEPRGDTVLIETELCLLNSIQTQYSDEHPVQGIHMHANDMLRLLNVGGFDAD